MKGRLVCVAVRRHNDTEDRYEGAHEEHEEHEEHESHAECEKAKYDLPYEQAANKFMSAKGYPGYVKKHGYHFTDTLAEHASRMMVNAGGQQHSWTTAQVKKAIESLGLSIPEKVTDGDVAYTANIAYADFYPDPLKDEASCLGRKRPGRLRGHDILPMGIRRDRERRKHRLGKVHLTVRKSNPNLPPNDRVSS